MGDREAALRTRFAACLADRTDKVACLAGAIGELHATNREARPENNALATVLKGGEGSCSALAATVLALTDSLGSPFEAVVRRSHVLLAARGEPDRYFEVVRGGAPVGAEILQQYPPMPGDDGGRVDAIGFLPYYVDNLAARLAEAGRVEQANAAFRAALELGPGVARIHFNYGTFLLGRDEPARAHRHLKRAIRLGWVDADAFVNRGVAAAALGRARAARRDFDRALEIDPEHREASTNRARLQVSGAPNTP